MSVPLSVPLPGLLPIAMVMGSVFDVTTFPAASSTLTVTAGVMEAPAAVLVGCWPNTSCVAVPITSKFTELEFPPPGAGLVTTTGNRPGVVTSAAVNWICTCAEVIKVTACATPLYVAVDVARKLVPLMVSVSGPEPAVAEGGANVVMVGTGFTTVKVAEAVPPVPPLLEVTLRVVLLYVPTVGDWT